MGNHLYNSPIKRLEFLGLLSIVADTDKFTRTRYFRLNREAINLAIAEFEAQPASRQYVRQRNPVIRRQTLSRVARLGPMVGWRCIYCRGLGNETFGPDKRAWHADHLYPRARGGDNGKDNLYLSCASCNLRKSAQLLGVMTVQG